MASGSGRRDRRREERTMGDSEKFACSWRKIIGDDAPHGFDADVGEVRFNETLAIDVELAGMRFVGVLCADQYLDCVRPERLVFVDVDEPNIERCPVDVDGRFRLQLFSEAIECLVFHSFPLLAMRMKASRVTTFTSSAWIKCSESLPEVK